MSAAGRSAWACAVGDYDNDGFPDLFVTAYGRAPSITTTATARSPTSPRSRACSSRRTWTTSAVWFDYDNDGKLDLFLCSFVEFSPTQQRLLRRQQAREALLLHPARLQADAELAVPQQRRRHVHRRRAAAPTSRRRSGKALGVVATDINNDGLHGPVRRQRHRAELPVREPRQGQVGRDRPGGRSRLQRQRHAAIGHGRGRGRFRRRRLAGSVRRQRRPGDVLALQERRERVLLATSPHATAWRRPRGC